MHWIGLVWVIPQRPYLAKLRQTLIKIKTTSLNKIRQAKTDKVLKTMYQQLHKNKLQIT